ncbi:tyrosine-type recombinase/integrase [Dictyobacter formicarum]|uniref:tyrosine-type recombinase/integrase n=1 Tax=Dictyobacter formicarum TaxID=2778368 RepID=UPI001F3D8B6B|nr:tyrosine-type recombinase/integrase [Dictyobacter formicarum]
MQNARRHSCFFQNKNVKSETREGSDDQIFHYYLLKIFKEALTAAGLPRMRVHDLRHSAAIILLSMNIHPKVVQELLGHSSINITMDLYSHILPSMQQDVINKLDDAFKLLSNVVEESSSEIKSEDEEL